MSRIFFSWQSELPNRDNRNFIEDAIKKAIKNIHKELPNLKIEFDKDTLKRNGSPDIANTIFSKIDDSDLFIADVSLITEKKFFRTIRRTPNPNVLIELGYAAKAIGWENVICIMNKKYGSLEELPFDLKPRRVISFEYESEKQYLVKAITTHIKSLYINGKFSNGGFVKEISMKNLGRISDEQKISFSKNTIIYGGNGTGKSLISDFIGHIGGNNKIEKWINKRNEGNNFVEVITKDVNYRFSIREENINFYINDQSVPDLFDSPIHVFNPEGIISYEESKEILEQFATYFNLSEYQFCKLINTIRDKRKFFVNDIRIVEGDIEIKEDSHPNSHFLSYFSLGGGMKSIVLIEIALQLSLIISNSRPSIFIFDRTIFGSLDKSGLNNLIDTIRESNLSIQTIFFLLRKEINNSLGFTEWELIENEHEKIVFENLNQTD